MIRATLWTMMSAQMGAWAWMQAKGGKLPDRPYIVFCLLMMTGQVGSGVECFLGHAWGTLGVQIYFFVVTAYGGVVRYRQTSAR